MDASDAVSLEDLIEEIKGMEQFVVDEMLKLYGSGFLEFDFLDFII